VLVLRGRKWLGRRVKWQKGTSEGGGSGGVARHVELWRKGVRVASKGVPAAEVGGGLDRGGGARGGN
jgi:hypothetical protein